MYTCMHIVCVYTYVFKQQSGLTEIKWDQSGKTKSLLKWIECNEKIETYKFGIKDFIKLL